MQVTERFRRGVVVPLDDRAAAALATDEVDDATAVWSFEFSDGEFEILWEIGIFTAINKEVGTHLDDYEEDVVEASLVPRLRSAAEACLAKLRVGDPELRFFSWLVVACDIAGRRQMPIYFVL